MFNNLKVFTQFYYFFTLYTNIYTNTEMFNDIDNTVVISL